MKDINFTLKINLKKFSALSLAEALWESEITKNEIKTYATSHYEADGDGRENEKKWKNIVIKRVLDQSKTFLSDELFTKVESIVVFIGEKVFNWFITFMRTAERSPFDQLYLPKAPWTQHGAIDDWKLYQAWRKDPMGPLKFLNPPHHDLPGNDQNKLLAYAIACSYADEDLIRESLLKIAKLIKKVLGIKIKDLSKFTVNSAMTILLVWYKTVNNEAGLNFNVLYSNLKSKEYLKGTDKMFLHCVDLGLLKCAEYFYKKLKETDRESIVQQAVLGCLSETSMDGQAALQTSIIEKTPEMLLYLLGKMTSEQRRIFLTDKIAELFACFLYNWPYQELCTLLLNYFWDEVCKSNRLRVLQAMFTIFKHNCTEKHYAFTSTIYQPLIKNLLSRTSHDLKKYIFLSSDLTFHLFKVSDFATIDLILEDPDCKALRWEIIDIGKFLPVHWILQGGHTQNIEDYMTHLQMSNEEKKNLLLFSKEPQLLLYLIKTGRFDEAEDLLNWRFDSDEQGLIKIKKEIKDESENFFSEFVKLGKYDLIEKYLNWMYKDDELAEIRKKLLTASFIRDQFWLVWIINRKESLKSAQKNCLNFLKYFFETDEKINSFKKENLIKDENLVKSVLDAGDNLEFFPNFSINFDEVAEFCSVSSEKVNEVKRKIFGKIVWYFPRIVKPVQFLLINALVSWLSDTDKKKIFKLLFLNDAQIMQSFLIASTLAPYNDAFKETRKVILLEWIKPFGDIEKLKKVLSDEKGVAQQMQVHDIQRAKDLLDSCKTSSVRSLVRNLDHGLV